MKKHGKYEKSAAPVVAAKTAEQKAPKVKNMLLQTYFTGLICLVLSVGMFLGTSYAWFTSEVTNTAKEDPTKPTEGENNSKEETPAEGSGADSGETEE